MDHVTSALVFGAAFVAVAGLVVAACTRALRRPRSGAVSGVGNALGNFIDVFDPAQSRAARDLQEQDNVGAVVPSPDDDDRPVSVDLRAGKVTIRRS